MPGLGVDLFPMLLKKELLAPIAQWFAVHFMPKPLPIKRQQLTFP
jgi:hypothetical protein